MQVSEQFSHLGLWLVLRLLVTIGSALQVKYRSGRNKDLSPISLTKALNLRNPMNLPQVSNLLVAVDATDDDSLLGWAQIRPLGYAQRDPNRFDAQPGSYDLQAEVDEQMWEDYEESPIEVPTGLASLPWTKEYQAMEAGVLERQERREALVQEALAERRKTEVPIWELVEVYVQPVYRGKGIGSELVTKLCHEYEQTGKRFCDLYLVCQNPSFFERFGFERIRSRREMPIKIHYNGNGVCMKGSKDTRLIDEIANA